MTAFWLRLLSRFRVGWVRGSRRHREKRERERERTPNEPPPLSQLRSLAPNLFFFFFFLLRSEVGSASTVESLDHGQSRVVCSHRRTDDGCFILAMAMKWAHPSLKWRRRRRRCHLNVTRMRERSAGSDKCGPWRLSKWLARVRCGPDGWMDGWMDGAPSLAHASSQSAKRNLPLHIIERGATFPPLPLSLFLVCLLPLLLKDRLGRRNQSRGLIVDRASNPGARPLKWNQLFQLF